MHQFMKGWPDKDHLMTHTLAQWCFLRHNFEQLSQDK